MTRPAGFTRREFLRVTAIAGGGLLAACNFGPASAPVDKADAPGMPAGGDPAAAPAAGGEAWQPNAFVRIAPDNRITIIVGSAEIGQGTSTAIPMLVAEELDADWELVGFEQSPTAAAYANPRSLQQLTAGSATIAGNYLPQRRAGAAIRQMLVQAAAQLWGVDAAALRTEASQVIDAAGGRRASYGELASAAAQQPVPANPPLKAPAQFRIIGQRKRRLDGAGKADGSAQFGFDFQRPGMLTALIARPPLFTDEPRSWNRAAALAVPGVVDVFEVRAGIAVVAQDFWSAKQARERLEIDWQASPREHTDSDEQLERYRRRLDLPGEVVALRGSGSLMQLAGNVVSSDYSFPYLAHAPMEPLSVAIDYTPGRCEIWTGTQWPDGDRSTAARVLGLRAEQVTVHTLFSGGSFGRRASIAHDFVDEATQVAKVLQRPVKVLWTREDDIGGGYYRPCAVSRLRATLGADGLPASWLQRIAMQALAGTATLEEFASFGGSETNSAQGASDLPYAVPNLQVDVHSMPDNVPVLWMRSVSSSFNIYGRETFLDELAQAAGQDPYAYRQRLLQQQPRLLSVLDAAAAAAGWSTPAAGRHRGIALFQAYGSCIAQVVEASVDGRRLKLHRIVSAVDCGTAINPDLLVAQIESAVVFALSSALFGEITLREGVPQQSNFHDYPILRMHQTPRIDTVLVGNGADPGGVGELGVPAVAPALANAIFAATGERLRDLPLRRWLEIA